ncbi:MAG: hypothetical protein HYT90_03595 [Candidatus Omnitrophica bacterium]|nr:hypothetical protein [Candidatus Omnitrophota bacterium]
MRLLACVGLLMLAAPAGAEEQPAFAVPEEQPVQAELIAEHASIQPGGTTRIGVHFEIEPGWHIYADPPGDAGLPTTIQWTAPRGVLVGPLMWPRPEQLVDPGDIKTSGYSGVVTAYSGMRLPTRQFNGQAIVLGAHVKWLACKEVCVPGSADLALTLPVTSDPPVFSTHAQLFEHTE